MADVNNEQICFSLPIIWLTRCTLGNILRMGIGFKRSVRPGYRNSEFYDAYDLIPVESESWVNLRRRDTDPIMYKPSGRLPERVWSGGRGGGLNSATGSRQLSALLYFGVCISVSSIRCVCILCLTWMEAIVSPGIQNARRAPGLGVRDNNCYLFSITNTFSVNCHQPSDHSSIGHLKSCKNNFMVH